ncbi:MAG TPA: CoB--CoM heterodisulfide reductase iron-sulfur subunit A family protein [Rectinemataceae bacterium]|nr:CoB--CoM heterodisulfide reductase iron-sulfur subunit A family protein [Rectinemataceae bacterium]
MEENTNDLASKENYRQEPKVGVYVCHCGGNISDIIDVKAVAAAMASYPGVAVAREYAFMCSSTGQDMITEDIKNLGINRSVVCACSPSLHELTFRGVLQRAGVNPYLHEHVNIREQASWVHKADHAGATAKAIKLAQAGVEKVRRMDPLSPIRVAAEHRVAVIGGGVAGMRAALSVAGKGLEAVIIEKEPRLGGKILNRGTMYPSGESGAVVAGKLEALVRAEKKITVHTGTTIERVGGFVGNFTVDFKDSGGKADHVKAGAIIMATGFEHYTPFQGEFGYGESPNVVTLPSFIAFLKDAPAGKLVFNGKEIKSLAIIHCVGSRQIEGVHQPQPDGKVNDYCSRVCCTAAITTANEVKGKYPDTQIYDIYRDIRTYGMLHEGYYEQASKNGVLFFRHNESDQPVVKAGARGLNVSVKDVLTWGEELEMDVDLVVLATGLMPSDIKLITSQMKMSSSADRFLQEVHLKLRPVELANAGIFIAGAAQYPMDSTEAMASAGTAAVKAAILLAEPDIPLEPFVATVDETACTGCGLCPEECSYDGALMMTEKDGKKIAVVNPALCKGCGACAAVCPTRAINLAGWTLNQFDAMVEAIARE